MPKRNQRYPLAEVGELAPGDRKIAEVAGKLIGLFNVHGQYVAILNVCPHELAPICQGRVTGTTLPSAPGDYLWGREGQILACPWHGWEFDLLTGSCLTDERRLHLYEVSVEDGRIYVTL